MTPNEDRAPRYEGPPWPQRRIPLRQAASFFVFMLVGALAVAIFTGDPAMLWGYVGAFTLTITIGIGLALRGDQHNRTIDAHRGPP